MSALPGQFRHPPARNSECVVDFQRGNGQCSRIFRWLNKSCTAPQFGDAWRCLVWVISGHTGSELRCPLFPRKLTCIKPRWMSAQGHKQTLITIVAGARRLKTDVLQCCSEDPSRT